MIPTFHIPFMGLGKIAIGLIATGVGVVAIGSIVGGVVASRSAETQVPENNSDLNGNNDTNSNQETGIETGNTNNLDTAALKQVLSTIKSENITLTLKTQVNEELIQPTGSVIRKSLTESESSTSLKVKDVYAFNVNDYTLGIDGVNVPENVTVEVSVDQTSAMNIANLNDGKLILNLVAKTNNNQTTATHSLEVTTFKQPSAELKSLFKNKTQTNNEYTLDVISKIATENVFSIEELNTKVAVASSRLEDEARSVATSQTTQPSTLTNLFKKTLMSDDAANMLNKESLNIEGDVKLEKITKEGNTGSEKTYFYLTSANNSFLKLTGKAMGDNSVTSEIAVKKVRLNNLAVSSISVVPIGNKQEDSNKFTETLKETWKMTDSHEGETSTKADALTVTIPMNGKKDAVTVNATAYTISKTSAEDTNPVKASLLVSFGTGTNAKIYDTSIKEQLDELKNAGFSFGVYSKDLGHTITNFKESDVNASKNKLEEYFKKESNKKPVAKPEAVTNAMSTQNGMFFLYRLTQTDFPMTFDLGKNHPVSMPKAEAQTMNNNQNWVTFANYSYGNLGNMMVLFPHSLSLIHVDIPNLNH